ncbi:death-associated protein 1-like [Dysidea avara]|uniref:death-associated protein 1-like n=1 Tax=Dysidea avara TaxID=196820 RepID=UPI00332C0759
MSDKDDRELKAGHAPAVKAGGKRIVSKGRPQEQDADAYDEKYLEQLPETPSLMIGQSSVGAVTTVDSYPADSIKEVKRTQAHNKPLPQHDKHLPVKKPVQINQPRK